MNKLYDLNSDYLDKNAIYGIDGFELFRNDTPTVMGTFTVNIPNLTDYKEIEILFIGHIDINHVWGLVTATTGRIPIVTSGRNRGILALGNNTGMYHRQFEMTDNGITFFSGVVYAGATTANVCVPILIKGYK